jgi:hypothetical protein
MRNVSFDLLLPELYPFRLFRARAWRVGLSVASVITDRHLILIVPGVRYFGKKPGKGSRAGSGVVPRAG